jgi:nicotinamidase/pyrazinamidase
MTTVRLNDKDALLVVDVQNDFLPGGSLAVQRGNEIIPVLNSYIRRFDQSGLPVYATRDWHPAGHCSFLPQGGIWPPHCVAGTEGAMFPAALNVPESALIISKADTVQKDAYSGFEGTALADMLRARGVERLFIGGLTTDYCVLNTVRDALSEGFKVALLADAIKAVDVHPGDGDAAMQEMIRRGAQPIVLEDIEQPAPGRPPHESRRTAAGPGRRA